MFKKIDILKRSYVVIYLLLFCYSFGFSQVGKVKGNKVLETTVTEISDYRILEIGQNFEVLLVEQETPRVRIETDENLHKYIKVDVKAEKLEIKSITQLARFKKLYVEVGYNEKLSQIIAKGKVVIRGNTSIINDRIDLLTDDNAEVELHFDSDRVDVKSNGKSKIKSTINADKISITMNNDSKLDTEIRGDTINIQTNEKSSLTLIGASQKCNMFINNNSELYSSEFITTNTHVNINGKSKAFINITDKLTINAVENTETYILGNPIINLESFSDEAKLIKLSKIPSSFTKFFQ